LEIRRIIGRFLFGIGRIGRATAAIRYRQNARARLAGFDWRDVLACGIFAPSGEERKTVLRRVIIVAPVIAALAALTGSASAQVGSTGLTPPKVSEPTQAELNRRKAEENAYQSAVGRISEPKQSADPWGDVRAAPATPAKKSDSKKQQ
jgi:hypothetical protein